MTGNFELLKLLLPYFKPYWVSISLVLLILPLGSITYSVQPIIMQRAVDDLLESGSSSNLWTYALALLGVVILNFIIQVYQFWVMNSVGQKSVAEVRNNLFAHLEKMSMSYFDRTPVGRSISRLTSDMEQLADSFSGGLILILFDVFNVLGIIAFMFWLNTKLTLVIGLFLVPIYFLSVYYQKRFRESNLKARQELSKLNSFLQQNIVGIQVVHVLNSLEKNMKKFNEDNEKFFKANDQSIRADAQLSAYIELVSLFAIAAMIFLCRNLLISDAAVTIGVVLAFLQYSQQLFEPIRNLSERFTVIQSAFTAAERIKQLIDEPIEIKDGSLSLQVEPSNSGKTEGVILNECEKSRNPLIEFKDLWFRYSKDTDWILKDLSFKIFKGEKVAITGRTGSGKSTIIKLLTRLYEAEKGSIKVCGIDIKDLKQDDLREFVAVIHQDSYVFAGDLESNIKLGRENLDLEIAKPFLEASKLELDTELDNRASNISAGEGQVLNFARAVVSNPEILVLDEATASIDIETEKQIQNSLEEFLNNDKTAIVIAHRLNTVEFCDKKIKLAR